MLFHKPSRWLTVLTMTFIVSGCLMPEGTAAPSALAILTPSPTPVTNNGWQLIAPGLERRTYEPDGNALQGLVALRIDPTLFEFQVHYRPGEPLDALSWSQELTEAAAFVNANFFDPEHNILGMLVSNGVTYGASYWDRGGMFEVSETGLRIRSLIHEPYQGEALQQAVQGFPMLVRDGVATYSDRGRPSRRTVIGQDADGRIILMATPLIGPSLSNLSAYLPTTDLNLVNAFNLDGGGSTLMVLGTPRLELVVGSLDPVPAVLAIYPRQTGN